MPLLAQLNFRWRPDWPSILLGLVLGFLLFLGWQKILPTLKRWQTRMSGRVQETQQWVRSGIDSRYRADVATYLERHHLWGATFTLPQIFVEPHFLAPAILTDVTQLRTNGPEQLFYLWPALASHVAHPSLPLISLGQVLLNGQRVALMGEPGAGKTMVLTSSAYLAATVGEDHPLAFLRRRVPVYVHLAEMDLTAAATDPAQPLLQAMQNRASTLGKTGLDGFLREAMQKGTASLFLDGWDNLVGAERDTASQWLTQLLTTYPAIQLIAAAPLRDYSFLCELQFSPTLLLPWRVGQTQKYSQQWHGNAAKSQTFPLSAYWASGQNSLETSLRHYLISQKKEGPRQQADLLTQFWDTRLNSESKTPPWLIPFAKKVWQTMAFRLVEKRQFALPATAVASLVAEIALMDQINERNVLSQWQSFSLKCGVLQQWSDNRLSFRLGLWRDFFAAAYLAQADSTTLLRQKLDDPEWRQVLRFYVGQKGGQALAAHLLEQKDKAPWYDALFHLASWLPEVKENEEWKRQLLVQLGKMVLQHELPMLLRLRAMATMALTRDIATRVFWQQLLQRPDPILREMAVLCLPLLGAEKVLDLWDRMLKDQTVEVRRAVMWAMAWSGEPVTERPLLSALVGPDEHLSQTVAEALAWNRGEGWDILKEALHETDLTVRRAAIWGLSQLNEMWVVEAFAQVEKQDKEWIVRTAAQEARLELLARNEPSPWKPLAPTNVPWLTEWADPQPDDDPDLLPLLLGMLRQAPKNSVRAAAALTLGHLAAKEAVGPLQNALRDPSTEVVESAFAALGQIRRVYGGSER
ncbi:MAG: HEAT repeat domain-containing protein [Chloroflexi bacterium]|nr:HEAT repeat domain-containing protein [Chloroflexota bacterium]